MTASRPNSYQSRLSLRSEEYVQTFPIPPALSSLSCVQSVMPASVSLSLLITLSDSRLSAL